MRVHRLPRRHYARLLATAAAALLLTAMAGAEEPGGAAEGSGDANTVALRFSQGGALCQRAAGSGETDDRAVRSCNNAVNDRSLPREDHIGSLINRGVVRLNRREPALALADFDAALAIDARNGEAYLNRGAALVMNGQPGPAVAAFTQALLRGVHKPHIAYYNRAAAREQLGDLRGAYEDYSTALDIEPDWGPAEAELSRFVRVRRERLASALGETPPGDAGDIASAH
ncbi:MAG: hypothetical protein AB7L65_01800 [Hyphomonadaceae bacterium]